MQENNLRKLAKFSFWFGCVISAILLPASCTKKTATTAIETIGSETVVTNTAPTDKPLIIGGYSTRYSLSWGLSTTFIPINISEGRSTDLSGIEQLQNLKSLWITLWDTKDVDFSPLETLPYLSTLTLRGWGFTTIPDLSGIPSLTKLEIQFGKLTNLNGVEKIKLLEELRIDGNYVPLTNTSSLRYLKNLKSLIIYSGHYNIDFSVFGDLAELEEIWLGGGGEYNLTGISQINSLEKLYLQSNTSEEIEERNVFKNIEEIGKITGLKELYLDESITSVEFLANNVNLEELRLFADRERDDYGDVLLPLDIKSLGNLTKLKRLIIRGFELENVDAVKKLPNLEYFDTALYESE